MIRLHLSALSLVLVLLAPDDAAADRILMVNWSTDTGQYDGEAIADVLTAAGHGVTVFEGTTSSPGDLAAQLAADAPYEQVWLFNGSGAITTPLDDPGDLAALAAFHSVRTALVLDSRAYAVPYQAAGLGFPYGAESEWVENEAEALGRAGGGMWLGGDHEAWCRDLNLVLGELGYGAFTGTHSALIDTVDGTHPIWTLVQPVDPLALWVGTIADVPTGTWSGPYGSVNLLSIAGAGAITYISTTITSDDLDLDDDGYSVNDGDCDDDDPLSWPGAPDPCLDGIDQDCDGGDNLDCDGDGYDAAEEGGDDCDDSDAAVHPGADELLNGADDDCDGEVDEGLGDDDDAAPDDDDAADDDDSGPDDDDAADDDDSGPDDDDAAPDDDDAAPDDDDDDDGTLQGGTGGCSCSAVALCRSPSLLLFALPLAARRRRPRAAPVVPTDAP